MKGRLAVGVWVLFGLDVGACVAQCQNEVAPPAAADFSSLRLEGNYLCDLFEGCSVRFETGSRATLTIADSAAGATQIVYDVTYGALRTQRQKVLTTITVGGQEPQKNCGTTHNYRWETWTVLGVTFTAVSATRSGQPLILNGTERVRHLPASTFATLVVETHYVDRPKGDVYLGVLVTSSPSAWTLAITRDGGRFNIGPA